MIVPSYKTIARNIGIFGGAQAISVLAALIRTKVAAVYLGSTGVGLSAIYITSVLLLSNIAGLGLTFSGVKYLSEVYAKDDEPEFKKSVESLRSLSLLCSLVGLVLTIVVSPFLSKIYFSDYDHIFEFVLLSIFVAGTIFSGIEFAILKACQKISYMTISMIITALCSVSISVPFYIFKGVEGVLWAVFCCGMCEVLLLIFLGHKAVSTRYTLSYVVKGRFWKSNKPMLILGFASLLGAIISYGTDMTIQSSFATMVSIATLGLYKAGYQLSIHYPSMIFTAVGNDFYPRLSAACQNKDERNILILRQIKVLLCITIPLIACFILIVPILLPLLFDYTFSPVCRMVQIASLSIIFKSVTAPLNYLPLALGKSLHYLLLEGSFWFLLIPCVIFGYKFFGLDGAGMAILLCNVIELVYVVIFCRLKYDFRFK